MARRAHRRPDPDPRRDSLRDGAAGVARAAAGPQRRAAQPTLRYRAPPVFGRHPPRDTPSGARLDGLRAAKSRARAHYALPDGTGGVLEALPALELPRNLTEE